MGTMRIRVLLSGCMLAGVLCFDAALAACEAPMTVGFRSTPPLLAAEPDATLVVSVHDDGCVSVHLPAQFVYRGSWTLQLGGAELKQLQSEVKAAGLGAIDPAALRARLDAERSSAKRTDTLWSVSDENIIEFIVVDSASKRSGTILRWPRLREDLLNAPADRDLLGMAAVRDLLEELAHGERSKQARGTEK
jgi:hypothetical protein